MNASSVVVNPKTELMKCAASPLYFTLTYCQIYDAQEADWIPFDLWQPQIDALNLFHIEQLVIALKARQLGMTWLALSYALWSMLYRPTATVLIFSKRDDEAIYLLGEDRLRGMYRRLPKWMQSKAFTADSAHQLTFANGSSIRGFPTTAGDSYTASLVIVDEADLVPDLNRLMRSVKPTIDAGGKLFMISRVDKSKPQSEFKQVYRAAKQKLNGWHDLFLAWHVRPERTQAWYEDQKRDILNRTGSLDDLHEQYPATDLEALAPKSLDKRIAPVWLQQCYQELPPITDSTIPAIPGLLVYRLPEKDKHYGIGVDPAEGNPTSDDSALTVLCKETGEEVAHLSGKFQPSTIAAHADTIGTFFNKAQVMVERNNHGHAVLLWLKDNSKLKRLNGFDGREGWLSSTKGKALVYDDGADAFRDAETTVHTFKTYNQLTSIEGSTLRAPEGENDDAADSYVFAWQAITQPEALSWERIRELRGG